MESRRRRTRAVASPLRRRIRLQPPAELTSGEENSQPFFNDRHASTRSKEWFRNLVHYPCFEGRNRHFVQHLVTLLWPQVFLEGEDIVKEGSSAYATFFMISGSAEMVLGDEFRPVMELPEGSIFGDMAIHGTSLSLATVRTLERCECCVIDYRHLRPLLKIFPVEEEFFNSLAMERKLNLETAQKQAKARQSRRCLSVTSSSLAPKPVHAGDSSIRIRSGDSIRHQSGGKSGLDTRNESLLTHSETLLGGVDFFSGCHPELLRRLAPFLELKTFEEGDVIIQEGDEGYLMYLLKSGQVEVLSGTGADEVSLVNFHDFHKVLRHFPDERVHFSKLAQERLEKNQVPVRGMSSSPQDANATRLHRLRTRSATPQNTPRANVKTPLYIHLSNKGRSVFKMEPSKQLEDSSWAGRITDQLTPPHSTRSKSAVAFARTFLLNKRLAEEEGRLPLEGRPQAIATESAFAGNAGGFIFSARSQALVAQRPASAGSVAKPYSADGQDVITVTRTRKSSAQSANTGDMQPFMISKRTAARVVNFHSMDSASFIGWPSSSCASEYSE